MTTATTPPPRARIARRSATGDRPYPGEVILGIDTSLGTAVGVVADDGRVLADVHSDDPRGHAEVIGDLIAAALAEAGAAPAEITRVAAGMGPGPFTGLRVGIAAARAFAFGRGIPVSAVASHDAAALEVAPGAAFEIVTDARRREEAYSRYTPDGTRDHGPSLRPRGEQTADGVRRIEVTAISGAAVARIAARERHPDTTADAPAEPFYLRAPDVTPSAGPKRVGT